MVAHGKAAKLYKTKYQQTQGGEIGLCVASAYYLPFDANSQADMDAVNTRVAFEFAFYTDPALYGDWPQEMKDLVPDNRLIPFTDDEKELLKGTLDYFGVNYYYSKYV